MLLAKLRALLPRSGVLRFMPSFIKVAHARQTSSNKSDERHGASMVHSCPLLSASFMARLVNSTGRTKSFNDHRYSRSQYPDSCLQRIARHWAVVLPVFSRATDRKLL